MVKTKIKCEKCKNMRRNVIWFKGKYLCGNCKPKDYTLSLFSVNLRVKLKDAQRKIRNVGVHKSLPSYFFICHSFLLPKQL